MTFWLEKYKTDRTYFGSAKMVQSGRWPMLYRAAWPFIVAIVCSTVLIVSLVWQDPIFPTWTGSWGDFFDVIDVAIDSESFDLGGEHMIRLLLLIPAFLGLIYGAVHYRFASKRILANHKHAVGVQMRSKLNSLRVSMIYVLGTTIAYFILILGVVAIVLLAFVLIGPTTFVEAQLGTSDPLGNWPRWVSLGVLGALYLSVFLFWGVLHNAFVTFPLMRHMAATLRLENTAGLSQVSQRARDEFAEAEGFAEALDLGAAI